MDVGGLDEGGSRLGRGTRGERRRLCGPLGTGEAQVSLARRKPTNPIRREGGALALSEPQWCN